MFITNDAANPVPVAASQKGDWTVGIDGTPTVKVAPPATVTLADDAATAVGGSNPLPDKTYSFETTSLGSVRVTFEPLAAVGGCNVRISSGGHRLGDWQFGFPSDNDFRPRTEVFETPGQHMDIVVSPTPNGGVCGYDLAAWGRP